MIKNHIVRWMYLCSGFRIMFHLFKCDVVSFSWLEADHRIVPNWKLSEPKWFFKKNFDLSLKSYQGIKIFFIKIWFHVKNLSKLRTKVIFLTNFILALWLLKPHLKNKYLSCCKTLFNMHTQNDLEQKKFKSLNPSEENSLLDTQKWIVKTSVRFFHRLIASIYMLRERDSLELFSSVKFASFYAN